MKIVKVLLGLLQVAFAINISYAQNCNLVEGDASNTNTSTYNTLKLYFTRGATVKHWYTRYANFRTNPDGGPSSNEFDVSSAAYAWNSAAWNGQSSDFLFYHLGNTTLKVAKDYENVVCFDYYTDPITGDRPVARTFIQRTAFSYPNRLVEVDTLLNRWHYWASGAESGRFDIMSVMLHEFGHWLALEHLYHYEHDMGGCDEFRDWNCAMYYSIETNTLRRNLTWVDKWGKWYIYSSGQIPIPPAPQAQPSIPEALRTEVGQSFPNPFNPETWIPYTLEKDAHVTVEIFNAGGQSVRKLDLGTRPAGSYLTKAKAAYWDGRNDAGEPVASGTYFYYFRAGDFKATRKLVVSK